MLRTYTNPIRYSHQVDTIDETLEPVKKAITSATFAIAQKKIADAATQEKFAKLKSRAEELQKKVHTFP